MSNFKTMKIVSLVVLMMFALEASAQDCPDSCDVFVPNVVTPDCDGVDCEFLKIQSNCPFKEYQVMIYNRWGIIIFESEDPENEFDSSNVDEGTYILKVDLLLCNDEKVRETISLNVLK